jgi:hypothetical protein
MDLRYLIHKVAPPPPHHEWCPRGSCTTQQHHRRHHRRHLPHQERETKPQLRRGQRAATRRWMSGSGCLAVDKHGSASRTRNKKLQAIRGQRHKKKHGSVGRTRNKKLQASRGQLLGRS